MAKKEEFLSEQEEQEVIDAIRTAEKNTSGEIRVHIEATSKIDPYKRALELFNFLKMNNTKEENAVLIYVAVNDKKFVIYGDKGIDAVVPGDFWNTTKDLMQSHFKEGHYKQGIIEGVLKAGHELKVHFPFQIDTDENELSNEISKG
jgi:uncharacterized membrane protein